MPYVGFSTGALSLRNFTEALRLMEGTSMTAVELSALRLPELPILAGVAPTLHLEQFGYVSFHAPSRFSADEEDSVISLLDRIPKEWPIIIHPDTIHDFDKWVGLGSRLAIENMDRRKSTGRSAQELSHWFKTLPDARLCFDLAHAHQCDRTMTEAFRILLKFRDRICQLHISELDSTGHHFPLSYGSMRAFSEIASLIPGEVPAIIESLNPLQGADEEAQKAWMEREAKRAIAAIGRGETLAGTPTSSGHTAISSTPVPA
jgi:sugar phosphate isomerase/epimerase